MKRLWPMIFLLASCLPQAPKDVVQKGATDSDTTSPFDPLAIHAWHLENTGQKSFSSSSGIPGEDHKITAAHALGYTGKNIRVVVSDEGVEINHPDLKNNELTGEHRNYYSGSPLNGYLADPAPVDPVLDAHGTAVSGLISAEKGNTVGSYGVAPDAQFAGFNSIKMLGYPHIYLHQLQGDFDIFNYSWGQSEEYILSFCPSAGPNCYNEDHDDIESIMKTRANQGSIYVKAAGNGYSKNGTWSNANFEPEQTLPYVIVTGAINANGVRSSYSTPGSNLWISGAGGEDGSQLPAMITTDLTGCYFGYAHQSYGTTIFDVGIHELNPFCDFTNAMNGTSSAAPVISGIIALMLEANPNLTWRDIKHILAVTADRIDFNPVNNTLVHPQTNLRLANHIYDLKWIQNNAGYYFSNWYGFGRANALKAVQMAATYNFPLGTYIEGTYQSSTTASQAIPDGSSEGLTRSINVSTSVSKIESVQVRITVSHADVGELGFELTSPQGTTSKLFLINHMGIDIEGAPSTQRVFYLSSNAFYGENPKSPSTTWILKVIDGKSGNTGNLVKWSIKINGH